MNKAQFLELQYTSPANRRAFFSCHFIEWWIFYFIDDFKYPLAPFHFDWIDALFKTDKNIFIKGFRGSIKTSIVTAYATWCICYSKHSFIVWQSFGSDSSERMTKQVALNLLKPSIERDYGVLFRTSGSREEMTKKSIGDFDTTNGIKVLATSLGGKLRGAISRNSRPDLLILDDIDVSDSVQNVDVINKNYEKITGETIGAMSKEKSRIIFLGNVIREDGIVPRFEKEKANSKNWTLFSQPLIKDKKIQWGFFTKDMIQRIMDDEGETAFMANYMLIPYSEGEVVIQRKWVEWIERSEIPKKIIYTIGIDPASSTKNFSDEFAFVITGHLGKRKYVTETINLKGCEKSIENAMRRLREKYDEYHVSCVNIEFVSLQREFCEFLYGLIRNKGMNVRKIIPTKDKVSRLMEYQAEFSRGDVLFVRNDGNELLVDQLVAFPNVSHDDMVDAMVYSFSHRLPSGVSVTNQGYF